LMLPGRFLEAAEATGLIIDVGTWTLRTALETGARWRGAGIDWGVTVNIAPRHFAEPGLVASIERMLAEAKLPPATLELEVTESTALSNVDRAMDVMQQLRAIGVRVSLDDFGAGYSVMNHLRRMPADSLKLEQSFVRGAPTSLMDAAVVRALTHIAQSGGMEIVAEGVETEAQVECARAAGVDLLQGYLVGEPRADYADLTVARALAVAQPAKNAGAAAASPIGPPLA
ncbi:MAG TPA: EAL domain-containing protein, partial [Longimicrobiales bacterium]